MLCGMREMKKERARHINLRITRIAMLSHDDLCDIVESTDVAQMLCTRFCAKSAQSEVS